MSEFHLRTLGVYKRFGRQVVLRDVSLEVGPGQSVAIFGANGAGKSSLLRILATLSRPSRGEVIAFGQPAWEIRDEVRQRIGVVGHQPWVYPELTCRENLRFFATMFDLDPDVVVAPALSSVGLDSRLDSRAATLSRGLLQRLNIARATLHRPDLLILDEPDTGLDRAGRAVLEEIVRRQFERGGSVIFTTHSHEFGLSLASRAIVLNGGIVTADVPASDLSVALVDNLVAARAGTSDVRVRT